MKYWFGARHIILAMVMFTHGLNKVIRGKIGRVYNPKLTSPEKGEDPLIAKYLAYPKESITTLNYVTMSMAVPSVFIAGILTVKFDSKHIMLAETLLSALIAFLLPALKSVGMATDLVIATILGIINGIHYPPVYSMMAKWLPPNELCRGVAIVIFCGRYINDLLTYALSQLDGYISETNSFYLTGSVSLIWAVVWLLFSSESPETCFFISETETNFIFKSIGTFRPKKSKDPIPWREIFKCKALYTLSFMYVTKGWTRKILLSSYINKYLMIVSNENKKQIADSVQLRLFMIPLVTFLFAIFADKIQGYKWPANNYRKLFTSIGLYAGGLSIAYMVYYTNYAMLFYTFFIYFNAFGAIAGYETAAFDVTVNYVGLFIGIGSTPTYMSLLAIQDVLQAVLPDNKSKDNWTYLLEAMLFLLFVTTFIFCCFADYVREPFDNVGAIQWKRASAESYPPSNL